jgi:hypothetical protein
VNWLARINSISEDFSAAARRTADQLDEVDARARSAASRIGEQVAAQEETSAERAAREAREERDRLMSEAAARTRAAAAERQRGAQHRRDDYVLPSDWSDIDEARLEGSGPPDSWLR